MGRQLSNFLPRYFSQNESIRELVEAADSTLSVAAIEDFIKNTSISTGLVGHENEIVNYILVDCYGKRIQEFALDMTDKKKLIANFGMLEDRKGSLSVIHFLYSQYDWGVALLPGSTALEYLLIPITEDGEYAEFQALASKLNPILEYYYLPGDWNLVTGPFWLHRFSVPALNISTLFSYDWMEYFPVSVHYIEYGQFGDFNVLYASTDFKYCTAFSATWS